MGPVRMPLTPVGRGWGAALSSASLGHRVAAWRGRSGADKGGAGGHEVGRAEAELHRTGGGPGPRGFTCTRCTLTRCTPVHPRMHIEALLLTCTPPTQHVPCPPVHTRPHTRIRLPCSPTPACLVCRAVHVWRWGAVDTHGGMLSPCCREHGAPVTSPHDWHVPWGWLVLRAAARR